MDGAENEVDEIFHNTHDESVIEDADNEINMNISNLPGPSASQYEKTNFQSKKKKLLRLLSNRNCCVC